MAHMHLDAILTVDVFGEMLCRVDAAVLPAGAAEGEHQTGKTTLHVTVHMGIGKTVHTVEESENLSVVLKKAYDRLVQTGQFLVRLIATRVVRRTTVEHISATIATLVFGNTLAI